jgi:diguanylate cyclase (GGDEF)-like protein
MKVLLAEDSRANQLLISTYIQEFGHEVIAVNDGKEAVDAFRNERPDLVLMDVTMPVMDGYQATSEIRKFSAEIDDWVPIIFLSALTQPDDIAKGIEFGGDDYLTKPIDPVILNAKLVAMSRISKMRNKLEQVNQQLKILTVEDPLTGIANRRHFNTVFEKEFKRALRNKTPISVIMCDIDHFKLFNDNYGHQQGDSCIQRVAKSLAKIAKRPGDLVARYGGEEFVVLLPETDLEGAAFVANLLLKRVSNEHIEHKHSLVADHVTMSVGVFSVTPDRADNIETAMENLLKVADKNLYLAKERGRNQVAAEVNTEDPQVLTNEA